MANFNIDYLVVAGGGGGAGGTSFNTSGNVGGGGGGAGGLLAGTAVPLTSEATYTINIGNGGAGAPWAGSGNSIAGTSGSDSSITGTGINATAIGGGGGGSGKGNHNSAGLLGLPGGSGGGSGFLTTQGGAGTVGQGNNGGYGGSGSNDGSGGGGGAGAVGSNGTYQGAPPYYYPGGAGGAGLQNSITGVTPTPYYAGGGGGGSLYDSPTYQGPGGDGGSAIGGSGGRSSTNSSYSGTAGAANTGSGGGGGCRAFTTNVGGAGSSGVIILRYTTSDASYTTTGTAPTKTTVGGETILSFTAVGTSTITFTASITKITNPELFNLGDSTSATQLPVMTTAQKNTMTGMSVGEIIFNSNTDKVEYWDGAKWYGITYEVPVVAFQSPATTMLGTTNQANFGTNTMSNNNRTYLNTSSGNTGSGVFLGSDILPNTGKYYWESVRNAQGSNSYYYNYFDLYAYQSSGTLVSSGNQAVGNRIAYSGIGIGGAATGWYFRYINNASNNTNPTPSPFVSYSTSEVWSYRFNTDTRLFETFKNGSTFANSAITLAPATYYQFLMQSRPGGKATANLQQSDWVYDPATL